MLQKRKKIVSSILLSLFMGILMPYSTSAIAADPYFATTADATAAATKLGYVKINELSSGQAVYKKSNLYITRDIDGHIGGAWKRATSVASLAQKRPETVHITQI